MFRWPLAFVAAALVAAVFGFGVVAVEGAWLGKALVYGFLALAVVSLVNGPWKAKPAARGGRRTLPPR